MFFTDPSYDNRTIASTLKMQIRMVQRLRAQLNASDDPVDGYSYGLWCGFKWGPHQATPHLRSQLESQHQSVPGCADPGCGSRTRPWPTSPKRPKVGFRRSAMTLYPSLTGLPPPPLDYFIWSYIENITNMTSYNTKASLITAIRHVFAELPPALEEKACSQLRIRIKAVMKLIVMRLLWGHELTFIHFTYIYIYI